MRPTAAALLSVLLSGCVQGDGPGPDETRYRLVRAGPDTLPVVVGVDQGCGVALAGGTVAFSGDRRYRASYSLERQCPDSVVPIRDPGVSGRVRFAGDTVFFVDSAGHENGHGRLTSDSLYVQGRLHRLVFARERPVR